MNHTNLNALSDDHPARSHPDWVAAYGKQLYYNPGIPEVRQFITDGIKEVVSRYDIDAVHMDDYFYPYKIAGQEFPIRRNTNGTEKLTLHQLMTGAGITSTGL